MAIKCPVIRNFASKIFEITYEMAKHSIEIGKEEKISDFGVIF